MDNANDTKFKLAVSEFRRVFGSAPQTAAFGPGRVNLIGEHTDYNDGFVMPFALPFRTIVVGSKTDRKDNVCRIFSCDISDSPLVTFSANSGLVRGEPFWANYVKGVVYEYLKDLPTSNVSFDAVITSNVPLGSGLSSSAALEVAVATFLEALYNLRSIGNVEKALRCQRAEHQFAGTPCGIMDQFISVLGTEKNLLLIDCRAQAGTLVPFGGGDDSPVVLITNSNVKHALSGSEYPDRVRQCREAVEVLRTTHKKVSALRDVSITELNAAMDAMGELVYSRALHVVSENDRTEAAAIAIKASDWHEVGRLMTESHISLQKNFEVSCPELDVLVNVAVPFPGVYGSRMTGGGFGGCTVTLVEKGAVSGLMSHLQKEYLSQTGKRCSFFVVEPASGAGTLEIPSEWTRADPVLPPAKSEGSSPAKGSIPAHPDIKSGSGAKCPFSSASMTGNRANENSLNWVLPLALVVAAVGLSWLSDY